MEQHPGITGVLIIGEPNETLVMLIKLAYADEDTHNGNCGYLEYDNGTLLNEWHPVDYEEAAEFSENVWNYDDFIEDFQPENQIQQTMFC